MMDDLSRHDRAHSEIEAEVVRLRAAIEGILDWVTCSRGTMPENIFQEIHRILNNEERE